MMFNEFQVLALTLLAYVIGAGFGYFACLYTRREK
jgi:hypothetical protein